MTPDALATLYEHHRAAWITLARQHRAGEDAEDVVQDAMVAALAQNVVVEDALGVEALVKLLAWRTARRGRLALHGQREYAATRPSYESPPVHDMRVAVQRAVDALDGVGPALVWAAFAQGATMRELAGEWEVTLGVVMYRLRRARTQLMDTLAAYKGDRKPRLRRSHGRRREVCDATCVRV